MNESCHIWMSHGTHKYVTSHITHHLHTIACVSHISYMWVSHVTYKWVMAHTNMSRHTWHVTITQMHTSCIYHTSCISYIWWSYIIDVLVNSYPTPTSRSWIMSHTHVSCQIWVMSRMNESCHEWMSHITHLKSPSHYFTHLPPRKYAYICTHIPYIRTHIQRTSWQMYICVHMYANMYTYSTHIFLTHVHICTHIPYICTHILYICTHIPYICTHIPYICTHIPYICTHMYINSLHM